MPAHMTSLFGIGELKTSELAGPFDFTKGAPLLKIRLDPANTQTGNDGQTLEDCETALFDLDADPMQKHPLKDEATTARLAACIVEHFDRHDAPPELYGHFGLTGGRNASTEPAPTSAGQK